MFIDPQPLAEALEERRRRDAERAIRSIDKLTAHLAELRASVEAWSEGKPARTPEPYGNAFGDAVSHVAEFRVSAEVYATLLNEMASA